MLAALTAAARKKIISYGSAKNEDRLSSSIIIIVITVRYILLCVCVCVCVGKSFAVLLTEWNVSASDMPNTL